MGGGGFLLARVLLGVSCDVWAVAFVSHIAEKGCSLPGGRCGPSPTFRFPSRGAFKRNKNPKHKTSPGLSAPRGVFPFLAVVGAWSKVLRAEQFNGKRRTTLPLLLFCWHAFQTLCLPCSFFHSLSHLPPLSVPFFFLYKIHIPWDRH